MIESVSPLGDNLFIAVESRSNLSPGGIEIPQNIIDNAERPDVGRVLAVGSGRQKRDGSRSAVSVPVGSRVLFQSKMNPLAAINWPETTLEGQRVLIVSESGVIAQVGDDFAPKELHDVYDFQ